MLARTSMRVAAALLLPGSISSVGCVDVHSCTLEYAASFSVSLCEPPSEEAVISGDGACAGARFECRTPSPCTQWAVFDGVDEGLCTLRLDIGDESDTLSVFLVDTGCGVQPIEQPARPYRMGPGCDPAAEL